MALLHIMDAGGRHWQVTLSPQTLCTIGRAPDNTIVLNDPRASRYHAHIKFQDGQFFIVDGKVGGGLSANHVFVNGQQRLEHALADGDRVTIGASELKLDRADEQPRVDYDEKPLGHTQLLVSANDVIRSALNAPATTLQGQGEELATLRRKAKILAFFYEMSKALSSVFDLNAIFDKATEIIFEATPADRVVALLKDEGDDGDGAELKVAAMRLRNKKLEEMQRERNWTIGHTITRKVMRERAAMLSQDAAADAELQNVQSIVSQGVRSTICAPMVAESGVHGALYADRLDPFTAFTRDDLELVTAVAAQAAVAVENARAHERLAREEVARANYSRFLPEYVVQQILENPDSFKLGGTNQTITVLFADVRGFTRISEHAPPDKIVQLLNKHFSAMTEIIFRHGGTLDKYIGDELMALFGAPTATPEDACNAVSAAISMQREMASINAALEEMGLTAILRDCGLEEISIGIGLNTGEATIGYIGSERRSEYTAIGDTVNLASRLQSNSQPGQILMSEATANAVSGLDCALLPLTPIGVKNRRQPVNVFEVDWRGGGAVK